MPTSTLPFAERTETHVSPKAALAWQLTPDWVLKASVGRAVRMPTVSELYQGSIAVDVIVNNDPESRSPRNPGPASSPRSASSAMACCAPPISTKTRAMRCIRRPTSPWCPTSPASRTSITSAPAAWSWPTRRKTCSPRPRSVRQPHLRALAHRRERQLPGERRQVAAARARMARQRARDLSLRRTLDRRRSARATAARSTTRSTTPIRTPFTFTGTSQFLVFDARVRCRIGERWIASLGIDNLGNEEYWAFHPLHPAHVRRRSWPRISEATAQAFASQERRASTLTVSA